MERIITAPTGERIVIEGHVHDDSWDVYVKNVNGHREISFRNAITWTETDKIAPPPFDAEAYLSQFDGEDREWREREIEEEAEARRLKQLETTHRGPNQPAAGSSKPMVSMSCSR